MNVSLYGLSLSRDFRYGYFSSSMNDVRMAGCRFEKLFGGILIGSFNNLKVIKTSFNGILSNCFTFESVFKNDLTAFSSIEKTLVFSDTSFHDFQYGSFSYLVYISDSSISLLFMKSSIYNIKCQSDTHKLIFASSGFRISIHHVCIFSCSLISPSIGVNSHVTNIPYCSLNYTYEFNITHIGSSYAGGRLKYTFYNNNGTNLVSTGNWRSAFGIVSTNSGTIGGYCFFKSNSGQYIGHIETGNTNQLSNFYIISNTATISLFDFRTTPTILTFVDSIFWNNSRILFASGTAVASSKLTITNSVFDSTFITSQAQLSLINTILSDEYTVSLNIDTHICEPTNEILVCGTRYLLNAERRFLLLFSFLIS